MAGTIDMKFMRYINLFSRISKISTTNCFAYNNQIIFGVHPSEVSQAIGKDAENVKKLYGILRKKIKIVAMPDKENLGEIEKFIKEITEPTEINKIEIKENTLIISANRQSKAIIIGRNRVREKELSDILKDYFHILKLKIV